MAGRPPKPTVLKLLTGNPGKRPLPKNEPKSPPGKALPPDWLDPVARALWDQYAPRYEAMGTLTLAGELAFATWMSVQAKIVVSQREGIPVSNETAGRALAYATQFGGTPSALAKMALPAVPTESKLQKYMSGAKRG
jgi:phage terminase small subunit